VRRSTDWLRQRKSAKKGDPGICVGYADALAADGSRRRRGLTKQAPPKPRPARSSLGADAGALAQPDDGGTYLPWCCSENYFWFGFRGYTPAVVSTDCPWRRAVREVIGKVLSRNLFELRDGSAQRVLRRLANCRTDGVSRRSGARGLQGTAQDPSLARPAGETAGSPPAQQANTK
jgi:hypothetical protein